MKYDIVNQILANKYAFKATPPKVKVNIGFLEDSDFTEDGKMNISKHSSLATVGNVKPTDVCVVEIYADWCGYCQQANPIYDKVSKKVSKKYGDKVKLFKINGTGEQSKSDPKRKESEMKLMEGIKKNYSDFEGFPTFYFFKNGEKIGKHSGEVTKQNLFESIKQMVNK